MIQLHQDYGGIPVLFIRYNPDSYKNLDSEGKPVGKAIRKNKQRLAILDTIRRIEYMGKTEVSTPLSVCYLFYDGYDSVPKLQEIKIFK